MQILRNSALSLLLLLAAAVAGMGGEPWEPQRLASQMRWPFGESSPLSTAMRETSRTPQHRRVEALLEKGDFSGPAKEQAVQILEALIAEAPQDPAALLTEEGPVPGKRREAVLRVRDLAYEDALLHLLTGEKSGADRARAILLRFAETLPHWPLYDRAEKLRSKADPAYLKQWDANGLWGDWYPRDLAYALPLLRAYDILRPTFTSRERELLETGLFEFQKRFDEQFDVSLYGNMDAHRLFALFPFGKVLGKPEYVHEAVEYWNGLIRYSYFPEGFWKEVTPDYHRQITSRTADLFPALLKGYSDPEGYHDPSNGSRFDNLDLSASNAARFQRMRDVVETLAMPDGTCLSVNDAWPKTQKAAQGPSDKPGLLGTAGIAKLGARDMVAFLKYTGIRGHDHRDALGLVWFAAGREVFSETGYQPLPGSGSTRDWNRATASHNTAAIDGIAHYAERKGVEVPTPIPGSGFHSAPPKQGTPATGGRKFEAASPAAARFFNQGRLLLWSAERADVQAMEAESPNAYPGLASLFRRTVVFVPLAPGEGYLVDIFRIRGGSTHDYFLRGCLDEPYTQSFDVPLAGRQGTVYSSIRLVSGAPLTDRLEAVAHYRDGLSVRSLLAGSGSSPAKVELLCGEAPAIRRNADAPFSLVRRASLQTGGAPLESCFVWVHEASRGPMRVRSVRLEQKGMDVFLAVELKDRTDYLWSGLSAGSEIEAGDWRFKGRLAYASGANGNTRGVVFEGGPLFLHDKALAEANRPLAGAVLSTTRRDAGDSEDSVLVEPGESAFSDERLSSLRTAHFDLGEVLRISIPIREARREGSRLRLVLEHTPGFTVGASQTVLTEFPGWRIFDLPKVEVEASPRTGTLPTPPEKSPLSPPLNAYE